MKFRTRDYAFVPSRVLLALLRGTQEERFIPALSGVPIPVQEHRKRATLIARLRSYRPSVLVLPLSDQRSRPTAPLIAFCRATLPAAQILVVGAEIESTHHLLATLRRDATVLLKPTDEQLRSVVLERALRARPPLPDAGELFRTVYPPFLRQVLATAWAATAQTAGLVLVATHMGTSTRTLEREARRQGLASPREMLSAIRFLRGYAIATLAAPDDCDRELIQSPPEAGAYEPDLPLPPLRRAVAHRVRALGGSMLQE